MESGWILTFLIYDVPSTWGFFSAALTRMWHVFWPLQYWRPLWSTLETLARMKSATGCSEIRKRKMMHFRPKLRSQFLLSTRNKLSQRVKTIKTPFLSESFKLWEVGGFLSGSLPLCFKCLLSWKLKSLSLSLSLALLRTVRWGYLANKVSESFISVYFKTRALICDVSTCSLTPRSPRSIWIDTVPSGERARMKKRMTRHGGWFRFTWILARDRFVTFSRPIAFNTWAVLHAAFKLLAALFSF